MLSRLQHLADPPDWDRARAVVAFDDASKLLVHLLKYQDQHEAGLAMARMMLGAGRGLLAEADVIVPVPLHRRRLWQAALQPGGISGAEDCGGESSAMACGCVVAVGGDNIAGGA